MKRVDVHIDRIVLRGFDPANRQALVSSLSSELSRVFADPEMHALAVSQRTPALRLGKMPMEPGQAGARKLGAGIAQSLGKGIKR